MSRYIDIDKVLKELHLNHKDVIYIDKNDTAKRIEKIQGIDIVRCKECRYCKRKRGTFKGEPIIFYRCEENNRDVESDYYCSWGEREGE